jgi:addiction module HigA family antidote
MLEGLSAVTEKFSHRPDWAIHPGEIVVETMEALGLTKEELSKRAGGAIENLDLILKEQTSITQATAEKLERGTGVLAKYWLNSQMRYDAFKRDVSEQRKI